MQNQKSIHQEQGVIVSDCDDVKQGINAYTGLNPSRLTLVDIIPMPLFELERVKERYGIFKGMCYRNAALATLGNERAVYCLGVVVGLIPIAHAWIEIDGICYDPTLQCIANDTSGAYYEVSRWGHDALWGWFDEPERQNLPPSLEDLPSEYFALERFQRHEHAI